jgi:hypothetical protein
MEPQYLGRGRMNQAINLETGAKASTIHPYFGTGGFAAPATPQTMELSSAAMVYQSEKLRDESRRILQETRLLCNRTSELAANVESLENSSEENALQSMQSALLAGSELERARSINNDTDAVARKARIWAKQQIYAPRIGESRDGLFKDSGMEELSSLRGQVKALKDTIERLDQRISVLENKTSDL